MITNTILMDDGQPSAITITDPAIRTFIQGSTYVVRNDENEVNIVHRGEMLTNWMSCSDTVVQCHESNRGTLTTVFDPKKHAFYMIKDCRELEIYEDVYYIEKVAEDLIWIGGDRVVDRNTFKVTSLKYIKRKVSAL